MNASFAELRELYAEWRHLSEGETEAIHLQAWPRLTQIQSAKTGLQPSINDTSKRWRSEASLDRERLQREHTEIQKWIQELLDLEKKNNELLSYYMGRVEEARKQLTRSSRNVVNVQRSYSRKTEPNWISYS